MFRRASATAYHSTGTLQHMVITSLYVAGLRWLSDVLDIICNHSLSYFLRLLSSDLRFHHPLFHNSLFDLSWYSYITVPYSLYVSLSLNINYVVLLTSAIRPNLLC